MLGASGDNECNQRQREALKKLNIGNVLNSTYMITEYNEYNSNVNFDCLSKLLKECKYPIYLNIYIIIIWDTKTQRCTKLYLQSMVPYEQDKQSKYD